MASGTDGDELCLPNDVMLWNEKEAEEKEIKQVGVSACGATAALNVLVSEKCRRKHQASPIKIKY